MEIKAKFICSNVDKPKSGEQGLHFRFLAIPEEPQVEESEEAPEEPEAPKEEDKKKGKSKAKDAKEQGSEESKEEAKEEAPEEAKEEIPETDGMPLGQFFEIFPKFPNREVLRAGKMYLVTLTEITYEEPIATEE